MIGTPEIAIIGGVVVILFGAKRLPEIGRSLAEGIHEFRKAARTISDDDEKPKSDEESK
ncbi:twin-arginine translocase TatA/TatE family subunit [bacterium]|nr:twin-arginine translocase TatA/TatE family subunit [bacterium]